MAVISSNSMPCGNYAPKHQRRRGAKNKGQKAQKAQDQVINKVLIGPDRDGLQAFLASFDVDTLGLIYDKLLHTALVERLQADVDEARLIIRWLVDEIGVVECSKKSKWCSQLVQSVLGETQRQGRALARERVELRDLIVGDFWTLAQDGCGNYVVQKLITVLTAEQGRPIVDCFRNNAVRLAMNKFTVRLWERVIEEWGTDEVVSDIVQELLAQPETVKQMCCGVWGNRAMMKLLEYRTDLYERLVSVIKDNIFDVATNKYASYLLQHALSIGSLHQKSELVSSVRESSNLADIWCTLQGSFLFKDMADCGQQTWDAALQRDGRLNAEEAELMSELYAVRWKLEENDAQEKMQTSTCKQFEGEAKQRSLHALARLPIGGLPIVVAH